MLPTFETTVGGYLFPFYHRPCNLKMLYTASLKLNIFRASQKDTTILSFKEFPSSHLQANAKIIPLNVLDISLLLRDPDYALPRYPKEH